MGKKAERLNSDFYLLLKTEKSLSTKHLAIFRTPKKMMESKMQCFLVLYYFFFPERDEECVGGIKETPTDFFFFGKWNSIDNRKAKLFMLPLLKIYNWGEKKLLVA